MSFAEAFNQITAATQRNVREEEGDYINPEDGLLYCGKCNTRKQVRVNLLGRECVQYCNCLCKSEAYEKRREEEKRKERMDRIKDLRRAGFPDADMQKMRFEVDDGKNEYLMNVARRYVDNFPKMLEEGQGLLFFGEVDGGKTFAAACIVNALIDKGYPCMITNFGRLINRISNSFDGRQEFIDSLNNFDLLAIDDLGTENSSGYTNGIVFQILNNRYNAGLPTIITSNITAYELKNPQDLSKEQIYSRLYEMAIPVECKQVNRRKTALKSAYKEYKDILGL